MIEEKYISNIINDILSIVDNAKLAVEMTRKEEREKAVKMGRSINMKDKTIRDLVIELLNE